MAFVDFLCGNDEKVTSSNQGECKNHTLFMTKMAKIS